MTARHRAPTLLERITPARQTVIVGACCGLVAGLGLAFGLGTTLGHEWTSAAHSTPTFSRPVDDDPGQRGRRGLPVPARVFPTDLAAPTYESELLPEVPVIATSSSQRACRCLPRVTPPATLTTVTSQTESAPVQTVTETTTPTAETTAATEPTTTEPEQPEETPVTEEPTEPEVTAPPVELPEIVTEVGGDE